MILISIRQTWIILCILIILAGDPRTVLAQNRYRSWARKEDKSSSKPKKESKVTTPTSEILSPATITEDKTSALIIEVVQPEVENDPSEVAQEQNDLLSLLAPKSELSKAVDENHKQSQHSGSTAQRPSPPQSSASSVTMDTSVVRSRMQPKRDFVDNSEIAKRGHRNDQELIKSGRKDLILETLQQKRKAEEQKQLRIQMDRDRIELEKQRAQQKATEALLQQAALAKEKEREMEQHVVDCSLLIETIQQSRKSCQSGHAMVSLHLCTEIENQYEYILPYIFHHLARGVEKVWILNSSPRNWSSHPSILCLLQHNLISIHSWTKRSGDVSKSYGVNFCFLGLLEPAVAKTRVLVNDSEVVPWGLFSEVNEFVIVHSKLSQDHCLGSIVEKGIAKDAAVLGVGLPIAHFPSKEVHGKENSFPPLIPTARLPYTLHSKIFSQIKCVEKWHHKHYPKFKSDCISVGSPEVGATAGTGVVDLHGRSLPIAPGQTPPLDMYEMVQLNHYAIPGHHSHRHHQVEGGGNETETEHIKRTIEDTYFAQYFSAMVFKMMSACPTCFSLALYPE